MITLHFTYDSQDIMIAQDKTKGRWHYNLRVSKIENFSFEPFRNWNTLQEAFEAAIADASLYSEIAEEIKASQKREIFEP